MSDDSPTPPEPTLAGASISTLAIERDSGQTLASSSPTRALAPASNTKLITAGLALSHLGPDYRYETQLIGDGELTNGVLDGPLRLRGTGAPDLDEAALATLADGIATDVDRVAGDLLVDGSRFTERVVGPGWTHGDRRHYYGAPSSAVALARNLLSVTVAIENGEVEVSVSPLTDLVATDVDVSVRTDATADDLAIHTDLATGTVVVRGAIAPAAPPIEESVPVLDPERHCGLALANALQSAGVAVDGTVTVVGDEEQPGADAAVLATVDSAPVRSLIREMNVPSDNFVAEQLARTVADGSWDAWATLVRDHFERLGVEAVRIRDGSGLSRYNLISARGLIAHLEWVDDQPWAETFFDSLPTPGEGTLSSRLDGVSVAAKTGTITGTSALTGLLRRDSRDDVFFSLLHGGLTQEGSDAAREHQDAFVRWLAAQT